MGGKAWKIRRELVFHSDFMKKSSFEDVRKEPRAVKKKE